MPEFILEMGTPEGEKTFHALDAFTQGYIEAMFFTNASSPDDGQLASATFADLAREALDRVVKDCAVFQIANAATLALAYDYAPAEYDATMAGRDFWYTRCGHGVGFWDRGLGQQGAIGTVGDMLSEAAHVFGDVDVYSGDDNRIYLS